MRHCGGASSTDSDLPGYGARGGGHGIRAATAPSVPQLPAAGSGGGAFAATGRMARLAALYAGAPDAVSGGGPATFDELRVQVGGKPGFLKFHACIFLSWNSKLISLTKIVSNQCFEYTS